MTTRLGNRTLPGIITYFTYASDEPHSITRPAQRHSAFLHEMTTKIMEDHHSCLPRSQGPSGGVTTSSVGLLDAEHMAVFRNSLDNILITNIAETTFSEIIDGLPTRESWLEFDHWQEGHPLDVLDHKQLCSGAREKARKLCTEFDVYMLSFPKTVRVPS